MKFKFLFENVLNHRKILENLARKDFSEAMSELNSRIAKLEKLVEELNKAREIAYKNQLAGGLVGSNLVQISEFIERQALRIEKQKQSIEEYEIRVEEFREILRLKAIDFKIIDKLKEKKKNDFNIEMKKKEQKRVDNTNTMRFFKTRKQREIDKNNLDEE